jgi:hypothetical protein
MRTLKQRVRDRAWLYLEPCVAATATMTLANLQQFVGGTYHPTDDQIRRLAIRMQVPQ